MLVDSSVDAVSLSNKVVCSADSVWRLYYDRLGQTEIPTKMAAGLTGSLANGDNTFYIVVTSQDGTQTNLYELTVHRSYAVNVGYYNGDTLLKSESVYTGSTFTANYTPSIKGYIFNGWKNESGAAVTSFIVWSATGIYVDKTAQQYKATFNVNGGDSLTPIEQTVTYDSSYQFPVPTRTGYSFTGWYAGEIKLTDAKGASLVGWNYAQNKTLTAAWWANNYTLTLNSDNTTAGTVTGGGSYAYDSSVTLMASTNDGYTFTGWYNTDGEKVSSSLNYTIKMGMNATYTAKWIKVTVERNNSSAGSITSLNGKYTIGEQTSITASTNDGYTWLGWYHGDTFLTKDFTYSFTMPSENVTYTAKWIQCPISVSSEDTTLGTVSGLPRKTVVGDSYTVEAIKNIGSHFIGWYKGAEFFTEEASFTFTMPNSGSVQYIAKWKIDKALENFNFTSDATTLTITGIKDKMVVEIIVPDYVTSISDSAFKGCSQLTTVNWDAINCTVAGSLYYPIFSNCLNLQTVNIGENVQIIPANAFSGCSSLTSITIPNSVTTIGGGAFSGCSKLTSVTIGNSVAMIGAMAFFDCNALTNIKIPNSVTTIGQFAFEYCNALTSVVLEDTVGWIAGGTPIESNDLANPSTAAKFLQDTFSGYVWKRS